MQLIPRAWIFVSFNVFWISSLFFWLPLCAPYTPSHKDWAKQGSKNKEWEEGCLILYHHHAQITVKSSWWPYRSTLGFSISKFGTCLQIRIWQELYKVYSSYNRDNLHNNSSYQETLDSATCTICRSLQWRITFAADGRRWGIWSFTRMIFHDKQPASVIISKGSEQVQSLTLLDFN